MPPTDLLLIWGKRLADHRKAAGLTQAELGRRVGISDGQVSRLEAGKHEPPTALRIRLAEALVVPTATLFPYEIGDAA